MSDRKYSRSHISHAAFKNACYLAGFPMYRDQYHDQIARGARAIVDEHSDAIDYIYNTQGSSCLWVNEREGAAPQAIRTQYDPLTDTTELWEVK